MLAMGRSLSFGRVVRAVAIALGVVFLSERAATAQCTLTIQPSRLMSGVRVVADIHACLPNAEARVFASLTEGTTRFGPFDSMCGPYTFTVPLGGSVKFIRRATVRTDANGDARTGFPAPTFRPRMNGVKVFFAAVTIRFDPDGSGGCMAVTQDTNVACSTIVVE
jgi:hypothetical protein